MGSRDPHTDHMGFVTSQFTIAAMIADEAGYQRWKEELLELIRSVGVGQDTTAVIAAVEAIPFGASEADTGRAGVELLRQLAYLADPSARH